MAALGLDPDNSSYTKSLDQARQCADAAAPGLAAAEALKQERSVEPDGVMDIAKDTRSTWLTAAKSGELATLKSLLQTHPELLGYRGSGIPLGFSGIVNLDRVEWRLLP